MNDDPHPHRAFIAMGSNIQPELNLPAAVEELRRFGTLVRVSSVWQSAPVGDRHQADFCNAAVLLKTSLPPSELKQKLRDCETRMGRVRDPHNKNAARQIDLDIACYDKLICELPELQLPDPDIPQRPFLAVPLMELDSSYMHPVLGKSLEEIAAGTSHADLQRRDDITLPVP